MIYKQSIGFFSDKLKTKYSLHLRALSIDEKQASRNGCLKTVHLRSIKEILGRKEQMKERKMRYQQISFA